MRILRVAQKVYPDVKGGGPYHVHAMSRDQADMGHDVTVLTVRTDPGLAHVEEREGYTVVRYDSTASPLGNEVSMGVARHLMRATDFDVVHAHSHLYFSTNLAAFARLSSETPLAITNHGLYSQTVPEELFDLYLRSLGRWTFNRADIVFCYTSTERERLQDLGVLSRIEVVPNGIDKSRFTPEGLECELIESDGPVVLFVGRLVEGKRPDTAIRTLEILLERNADTKLYLCGDGPLRDDLETLATDCGVADQVSFLGQVPYDEMPRVYRSADVLIQPSRAEGVPRTVLEAVASGTPVVTSDLDQIKSIVERNGQVVHNRNCEQFAIALEEEISESSSQDRYGCQSGFEVHDWSRTVERTTEILENVYCYNESKLV